MSHKLELVYSSNRYQIFSYNAGSYFEVERLGDQDRSVYLEDGSAAFLALTLDGFEDEKASDEKYAADVDRFLTQQYFT